MSEPLQFLPFEHPATTQLPAPRAPLDDSQRASLNSLINHFNEDNFKLASPLGPTALTEVERCYWSEEQFLRVLRATKWNRKAALTRALETANWRRDFGPGVEEITAESIEKEALTGKEIVLGFDFDQRPVLYLVSSFVLQRYAERPTDPRNDSIRIDRIRLHRTSISNS